MEYELKLTGQEIQMVLNGLGEISLKHSIATFAKIQKSVAQQDASSAVPLSDLGLSEMTTMAGNGNPPPPVKPA